jgi:hypothetical protein
MLLELVVGYEVIVFMGASPQTPGLATLKKRSLNYYRLYSYLDLKERYS